MIYVVDLGCATYAPGNGVTIESIPTLIKRFRPDHLYGFDPSPQVQPSDVIITIDGHPTRVTVEQLAAWTEDTTLTFAPCALGSTVMREKNFRGEWRGDPVEVSAFDFPAWLREKTAEPDNRWIVKMDCEGSEFPILQKMHNDGSDALIDLLLVEWHDWCMDSSFRDLKLELAWSLRCPVEEWEE